MGLFLLVSFGLPAVWADQIIMKDGTVYKGKILLDGEKAVIIGNPPFDPASYYLENKDIEKIIYEEYHLSPPAERKRGLMVEGRLGGRFFTGDTPQPGAAPSLYAGAGFRLHPLVELNGGLECLPWLSDSNGLSVTDTVTIRRYEKFAMTGALAALRIYPLWKKPLKCEPYFIGGYRWSRLRMKGTDDSLSGAGWLLGAGAIYPLATHWFLESRLQYGQTRYDEISFLGRDGSVQPEITQRIYEASLGISWRL